MDGIEQRLTCSSQRPRRSQRRSCIAAPSRSSTANWATSIKPGGGAWIIDGWTTDAEQDRLARLLAAQDVPARSTREYLAVRPGTAAPALDALVEDRVPTYRAQFAAKAARQPKRRVHR